MESRGHFPSGGGLRPAYRTPLRKLGRGTLSGKTQHCGHLSTDDTVEIGMDDSPNMSSVPGALGQCTTCIILGGSPKEEQPGDSEARESTQFQGQVVGSGACEG